MLTNEQIAEGWIAADGDSVPEAIASYEGPWEAMWRWGDVDLYEHLIPRDSCGWKGGAIAAYRIVKPSTDDLRQELLAKMRGKLHIYAAPAANPVVIDANAAMLARDAVPPKPVPALKWPAIWQPSDNLLRVAPVGMRAWGEQS